MEGVEELPGRVNYFLGADRHKWRQNISTYRRVTYRSVYPGVDLVYYGRDGELEYDFIVAPRSRPVGDPSRVRRRQPGGRSVRRFDWQRCRRGRAHAQARALSGHRLRAGGGEWRMDIDRDERGQLPRRKLRYRQAARHRSGPVVRHVSWSPGRRSGRRHRRRPPRPCLRHRADDIDRFSHHTGGFSTCSRAALGTPTSPSSIARAERSCTPHISAEAIVISAPTSRSIALGNAYVVGSTRSVDFPITPSALQPFRGEIDAFVMKLNRDGSGVVYSTLLGGAEADFGTSIAIDAVGRAFVTGDTSSVDFPTTVGAFQTINAGRNEAFVASLSRSGDALRYSTYLGGSAIESGGRHRRRRLAATHSSLARRVLPTSPPRLEPINPTPTDFLTKRS